MMYNHAFPYKLHFFDHSEKSSHIVSKRVDDLRERTQPQLGKVHDPIKDTMNVPADHTFGVLFKPDECGAGDLIHGRVPGQYLRYKDKQRSILAAIRQHLKKANYQHFLDLRSAFRFYDKVQKIIPYLYTYKRFILYNGAV